MAQVPVRVSFAMTAARRFMLHDGQMVPLDAGGSGVIQVEENEADLILFGIIGTPGNTGTITLTPPATHRLDIASHPIQIRIAQGKTRAGSSRFFQILQP
jgi:hypothetical protein